jgi:rubrerythrin
MTTPVATFLAHALAMENEAADRYDDLADTMEVHNNPEVADLFRQMSHFSRLHAASVAERAAGHDLPELKSWQFRWNTPEPPEVGAVEGTHYLMTPFHALSFALDNERRGRDFYAAEAAQSLDAEVRHMAAEMTQEESDHVAELERWIERTPKPETDWADDPDEATVAD